MGKRKTEPAKGLESDVLQEEVKAEKLEQAGLKGMAGLGGGLKEIKEKVPVIEAGKDHAYVMRSLFSLMKPFMVENVEPETDDVIEEHFATETIQLKPKKHMVQFNKAVGSLLGLLDNKGFKEDAGDEKFDVGSFTSSAHDLRKINIGRNAGTKELSKGKPTWQMTMQETLAGASKIQNYGKSNADGSA